MVSPVRSALLALSLAFPLSAAVPVGEVRTVPAGQRTQAPIAVRSGDRALVIWDRGNGAVRFDAASQPLDVPAIGLPQPVYTAGADLVATDRGWIVGWTIFDLDELSSSSLQLVDVGRDGTVSGQRVYPLPEVVSQLTEMRLAVRGDVTVVAYPSNQKVVVAAIDARGRVTSTTLAGGLGDLVATPSGFALVSGGSVVLLPESGVGSIAEIALPTGFGTAAIEPDGADLLLAGFSGGNIALVRVRDGEATMLSTLAGPGSYLRFSRNGREVLLVWKRPITAPFTDRSWDLMAARVALDGTASEPVLQRPRIDLEGRLVCCPDPPDVVAIGDGWTLLWSEGYRTDSVTSRNIFSARIGTAGPVSIDTPRLMTYRAASQQLVGTAHHGDVVLVVWQEPYGQPLTYAARFTVAGRRIDAHDIVLGAIEPRAVRATPSGFAVLGLHQIVRIDANDGTVASSESPAPLMDLSCAGGMCLAAWVESTGAVGPAAIRVSRWRDGVLLDAPGMVVHFSDTLYHDLEMANDGERFLVAFARQVAPGGSILSVARVDPAGGEWRIRTSDLAASSWGINSLRLVFEGDGYIAAWHALPWRASRWTRDGDAVDGDETGYEGWPVEMPVDQLVYDGARTLIVSGSTLFELQGRVPVAIQTWPGARAVAIECVAPRVCATVTQEIVRGRQWYEAERLLFRGAVTRVRAVRPR